MVVVLEDWEPVIWCIYRAKSYLSSELGKLCLIYLTQLLSTLLHRRARDQGCM